MFPIMRSFSEWNKLGLRSEIPWEMIAPHEGQALINHHQSLARLAERGGLDPREAVAVIEDRRWQLMNDEVARARLEELVRIWGEHQ